MSLRETHLIGGRTRERIVSPRLCTDLAEHHIVLAGHTIARQGFRFIRLQPRISQILACTSGVGLVYVNDRWLECGPGTAYITPPGVPHAYQALPKRFWEVCWVAYEQQNPLSPSFISLAQPALIAADTRPLSDAILGLHREMIGLADPVLLHHWAELLHAQARRIIGPASPESRLRPLWEAVETDLARNWSLEAMAEIVDISGEHLRRLCVRQFRHSPIHHVTYLRMQRATELLASTQRKIQDIASAVGYNNAFAFATAFKRHLRIPPSRYRTNVTNRLA